MRTKQFAKNHLKQRQTQPHREILAHDGGSAASAFIVGHPDNR